MIAKSFRAPFAKAYAEWATNPHLSAQLHVYLFGEKPEPVTSETVAEALGEEAAVAWEALRQAFHKFMDVAVDGCE